MNHFLIGAIWLESYRSTVRGYIKHVRRLFVELVGNWSALDNNTNNRNNAETTALLRELITAVKQGSTIEVNGKTLGQTVRKEAKECFSRTGNPMFEF